MPLSRRTFVTGGSAALVTAAVPVGHAEAADAPPLPLYRADFANWSGEIRLPSALTCTPTTQAQVAAAATWAHRNGYRVRARGSGHGWSPLIGETGDDRVLLVDMRGLRALGAVAGVTGVRAESGATLEEVLTFLAARGWGLTNVPDIGNPTIGGLLAIGGHGAAVPADGEVLDDPLRYGSLSNRVLSLTAVAWDPAASAYRLRRFGRGDPATPALLTSLGRALVTEVVIAAEPDANLRCRSTVQVPVSELFGAPGSAGRSVESYLRTSGRIDILWYAFTERPWLKAWYVSPSKPLLARRVYRPYNYPFTDNLPDEVSELARQMISGNPAVAPLFGPLSLEVTGAGLLATASSDLWGKSKDVLLWLRPSTLRVHQQSYAILTRRRDVQQVLHEFHRAFVALRDRYAARGEFPVNMPLEIRVTGVDRATPLGPPPALSALSVGPGEPWQAVVWISVATLPGTPDHHGFNRELEQWILDRYDGATGLARPEWSKGWGYTDRAGWADPDTLAVLRARYPQFAGAMARLDALDPHGTFSSPLIDRLRGLETR